MMTTKKKALLILGAVMLTLAVLAVVLTLIFHRGYLQKTDYDHVSEVAYNDLRIVGRNGLFYLFRDGKAVSEGYVSLQSVNDAYAETDPDWQSAEDLILYDFYIGRRAGKSEYYLLSSDGDEYMITGDNYSLSELRLPYLIFVNNTTGRRAVLSLDKLDSDLSYRSGNELTLKPFTSVTPVRQRADRLLYSHLETYDASAEHPYSVFSKTGSCLFSAEGLEKKSYERQNTYWSIYYRDTVSGAVYNAEGDVLGMATSPLTEGQGGWCWAHVTDEDGEGNGILLLSARKSTLLSEKEFDLSAPTALDGCLILAEADGEGMALVGAADGTVTRCKTVTLNEAGLPVATLSNQSEYLIFSENAVLLMKTEYADMVLVPSLSDPTCCVFESAAYNEAHEGRYLHFTREGSAASTVGLEEGASVSLLSTRSDLSIIGSFLLTEQNEKGDTVYRLLLPFTTRIFSDTYDVLDVYEHGGILWAHGTSFGRLTHTFLDPLSGQTALTVACTEEEMALARFDLSETDSLLPDPYHAESAVPMLMLRLSYDHEDSTASDTVRYFALYRSAAAASRTFSLGTLRVTEIGKGLLRTNPFDLFPADNAVVCHDADSSRVYRLNDANVLSEVAAVPYHVTGLLHDASDPSVLYFLVTSDTGKKGLYDTNGSPVLAPYYDDIQSADNGHFVVSLRGAYGVVEYTAGSLRKILDYLYVSITALPDHGYLAVNGDREMYLFEGQNMLTDRSVQSYSLMRSYRMNENGELCYRQTLTVSIEGQLSLHDCETELRPTATSFERITDAHTEIHNPRALAIYYHHEGRQTHVRVLMPIASDRAAFHLSDAPDGEGWYRQPHAEEGVPPVTEADILAFEGHTLKLYTKS